jgi:hypothetical protein
LGGNKGAVISKFIGVPVSSSTIVRIIKKLPNTEQTITSGIIGIDDWAFKKGRTYGTIIVELNSNQVVDLLQDREAATVSGDTYYVINYFYPILILLIIGRVICFINERKKR